MYKFEIYKFLLIKKVCGIWYIFFVLICKYGIVVMWIVNFNFWKSYSFVVIIYRVNKKVFVYKISEGDENLINDL